jgi:hypothetical protein
MKLFKLAEILKAFADTGIVNEESDVIIDVPDKQGFVEEELDISGVCISSDNSVHLKINREE